MSLSTYDDDLLLQLFMVSKTGEAESITSHYLFALGSYRGLYILNWVYRYVELWHCFLYICILYSVHAMAPHKCVV